MKKKIKFISTIAFLIIFKNLYSYEIIRDPIFEDYFEDITEKLELKTVGTYLVKNKSANAFVLNNNIYFTTGLLEIINNEDTLKAIFLHEYGHIIKNHFQSKKIKIQESNQKGNFYNLFSVGLAIISGNVNMGVGTSITLNSNVINEISKYSLNFEIEADNFMINELNKNEIGTSELISFLNSVPDPNMNYFRTHPRSENRISNLKKINYKTSLNSIKFEWIKSKYTKKSGNENFNLFFKKLEKGIYKENEKIDQINEEIIRYEVFKKGLPINNWHIYFQQLLKINDNSFLKIEYINYLLDNNLYYKYEVIENFKFDQKLMKEFFYYYVFGKYYNKVGNISLSNFYFCQFYKVINSANKADFFCEKYDIKDIPRIDKTYALFK